MTSPDKPDKRDTIDTTKLKASTPTAIDLGPRVPVVLRQGLHDCAVHAVVSAFMFLTLYHDRAPFVPSRRFLYYGTRKLLGSLIMDNGGNIRSVLKALQKWGAPPEEMFPYDLSLPWRPHWITPAPPAVCTIAADYRDVRYAAVRRNTVALKAVLADGYPVIMGFVVPDAFSGSAVAKTGRIDQWSVKRKPRLNHAALLVGMDDRTGTAKVLNSFGPQWGQAGYFEMPYSYLLSSKCYNFWVLRESLR